MNANVRLIRNAFGNWFLRVRMDAAFVDVPITLEGMDKLRKLGVPLP